MDNKKDRASLFSGFFVFCFFAFLSYSLFTFFSIRSDILELSLKVDKLNQNLVILMEYQGFSFKKVSQDGK